MWHGILVINKERGLTSHQVVANLRRVLKQAEVGHTGTLDPEATGVLVVGLGQATRSFSFLNEDLKVYRAEIIFGQSTDTQDATGKVIQEQPGAVVSLLNLEKAVQELTGEITQIPPMFSAVKVNGQKLYELARKGLEIDRIPRKIKVINWRLLNPRESHGFKDSVSVEITCSKGTYIRTLIHDLGAKLGVGAHMGNLIRIKSGMFSLDDSLTVAQTQDCLDHGVLEKQLIPINVALEHLISLNPTADDLKKVANGGKLSYQQYEQPVNPGTLAKVLDQTSRVIAVAKLEDAGEYLYWQPLKVFNYQ